MPAHDASRTRSGPSALANNLTQIMRATEPSQIKNFEKFSGLEVVAGEGLEPPTPGL